MKSRSSGKEQQMHKLNTWASAVVWSMSLVTIPILLLIVGKVALANYIMGVFGFGGQGYAKCNCAASGKQCRTKRCKCFKSGVKCNSRCHSSITCANKNWAPILETS